MMKSLYSGVAGLKTHNQRMDVIGNNISNVNTTAFKASTVTFKDIFYQNKSRASSGSVLSGGTNANQVGYGASLNSIAQLMTQSGLVYSDRTTDCAIAGEGFFQVMDEAGNIYYTRNGSFHIDNYGNLCDASGNIVLGVSGDPTGVVASSQRINLYVPPIDNKEASVTKTININNEKVTFTVSANIFGEEGNISLQFINGDIPFATRNGSSIVVQLPLDNLVNADGDEITSAEEFAYLVNQAILAGGIDLGDVLPLQFDFEALPTDVEATTATNELKYSGEYTYLPDGETDPANTVTKQGSLGLSFTSSENAPGDYANGYEIDIVANSLISEVKARWDDNVLVISIPASDTKKGATIDEIQAAIDKAAGTNVKRQLKVAQSAADGTDGVSSDLAEVLAGNGTTLRLGLTGGKDNFFKNLAEVIGTIKLTDGRRAAEQTTEDLEEIFIDDDGVIYGVHAVHGTFAMGRIDLALFENPEGLDQYGTSYWKQSLSSGEPEVTLANSMGAGSIVSGALEMSNTDLAQEISDMIITQRGYQANTRVITVTDQMLEELVNLKR